MQFKQFRYYPGGSGPSTTSKEELISGSAFQGLSIMQLGIKTIPGTKFYLNNNDKPVIIGFNGVLELDFAKGNSIQGLKFDEASLNIIDNVFSGGYLIVDIMVEGGES